MAIEFTALNVAGLALSLGAGWVLGMGVNRLAIWLPARHSEQSQVNQVEAQPPATPAEAVPAAMQMPSAQRQSWLNAATAITLGALWWRYGPSVTLLPAAVLTLYLLLIAAIDIDHRLVLNEVLLAGAVAALVFWGVQGFPALKLSVVGGVLSFALFFLLALLQRGAMGAGDVKLAGVMGLALGYPLVMQALMVGVIIGGVAAGVLLVLRRVGRKSTIAYAPFLAAGGILILLFV